MGCTIDCSARLSILAGGVQCTKKKRGGCTRTRPPPSEPDPRPARASLYSHIVQI
eukprot:COSAG06_NODE_2682_length_6458_cov_2.163862_6_plen_55_part_00